MSIDAINLGFGPPPLATAITQGQPDEFGIPFQSRGLPSGGLNVNWAAWFNALFARVTGSPLVQVAVLTAASTTFTPPTTSAAEWVVVAIQDGAGGRAVVWGSGVVYASAPIDTTANTVSVFRFVRAIVAGAEVWVMAGQPTTGML